MTVAEMIVYIIIAFIGGGILTYVLYKNILTEITKLKNDWQMLENRLSTKLAVIENKIPPTTLNTTINPNKTF